MSTATISTKVNRDAQLEITATREDGGSLFDRVVWTCEQTVWLAGVIVARRLREGSLPQDMTLLEFALSQGSLTMRVDQGDRDLTTAYEEIT